MNLLDLFWNTDLEHGMRNERAKVLFTRITRQSYGVVRDGEIRTPDLLLRRQPLYPAELRARTVSTVYMGKGNSFNVACSVIRNKAEDHRRRIKRPSQTSSRQYCREYEPRLESSRPPCAVRLNALGIVF